MALTAYQTQFKLRAKADAKARRYAQLLADSIGAAEDAATQMNALNQFYNVDVSTYTLLTKGLHDGGVKVALVDELAQSTPGEELIIFNQVPDGNGGQPLPDNVLFGEVVAGTPIIQPAQAAKTAGQVKDTAPVDTQASESMG